MILLDTWKSNQRRKNKFINFRIQWASPFQYMFELTPWSNIFNSTVGKVEWFSSTALSWWLQGIQTLWTIKHCDENYFNLWFNIKIISTWMGKKYDHDLINNMHTNMTRKSKCIRVLVMTKKGKYIKVLVYVDCPFNMYHQFGTYLKCRCIF